LSRKRQSTRNGRRKRRQRARKSEPQRPDTGIAKENLEVEKGKLEVEKKKLSLSRIYVTGTLILATLTFVFVYLPGTPPITPKGYDPQVRPRFDRPALDCWNSLQDAEKELATECLRVAVKRSKGVERFILDARLHIELKEFEKAEQIAIEGLNAFPESRELEQLRDEARSARPGSESESPDDSLFETLVTDNPAPELVRIAYGPSGQLIVQGSSVDPANLFVANGNTAADVTITTIDVDREAAGLSGAVHANRFDAEGNLLGMRSADARLPADSNGSTTWQVQLKLAPAHWPIARPPLYSLVDATIDDGINVRPVADRGGLPAPESRLLALGSNYSTVQPGWSRLRYAEEDVTRFVDVLGRLGYRADAITGPALRASSVVRRLEDEIARSRSGDSFVLFFSGHTYVDPGGRVRLLTAGGVPDDTALDLVDVTRLLAGHRGDVTLVIDGCMDARFGATQPEVALPLGTEGNVRLLFAASPGEQAIESVRAGHGVFTYALAETLQRLVPGEPVDWAGVFRAAGPATARAAAEYNHVQTPTLVRIAPKDSGVAAPSS